MGLLAKFGKWLTTSARGRPKKGHPDLYPIDVDKLARELNLVEEARRLGEAGLPAADAKAPSGPEAAVIQRVEKARQDYVDWAVLRLNVLSETLGRRNVTQDVNRARHADLEFERKASAFLTEQDSLVRSLGESARKGKLELDDFQKRHRLTRDAHYPTAAGSWLGYGILLALIVVEAFLNATFFAQGLTSGLIGGFSQAGALAALNVLIAFAFGKWAVPYANHVNLGVKALGLVALLLSFTVMVAVGLGISHYRDSLTADMADPARAALKSFLSNPAQLRDILSWALFGISVAFGLSALFDGLLSDDRYPGYGRSSRRTQLAVDDYEDELDNLRASLEELKDEELASLDKIVRDSQASVAVSKTLIDDKRSTGSRLLMALRDADNSLEALLRKFRTENELHRQGIQRPEYFDQQPQLRPLHLPDFSTSVDEAQIAEQQNMVTALLADVQEIRGRIQAAFNQQFDRLTPLGTHFPSKGDE